MTTSKAGPMSQLLAQVQDNTKKYLDFFSSQSLPEPSYENGNGLDPGQHLPADIQAAKVAALEATDELHHLLLGPLELLVNSPGNLNLMLGLQYIFRYRIAYHVPEEGETSFQDISQATGRDLKDVTRFLRVAISRHVFHEPRKGVVVHTAASRLLLNNQMMEAWITNIAENLWPNLAFTVDATEKWPGSEEPNESGFSLAHHTTDYPFDVIKKDPARQQRFVDAMTFSHMHSSYNMEYLLNSYDFGGARTIVDVGGSQGQIAIALARKYPSIQDLVVQDLPSTIAGLDAAIPPELKGRIRGMVHDFLTPQPLYGADVYLLRWILHDWSDKYCVKILQALIPGLKKGARIIVNDVCIPEPGMLGIAADRALRNMDIWLKAFNNARERDSETWVTLFRTADLRFKFVGITVPQGARMSVIEAEWTGDDQQNGSAQENL